MSGFLVGNRVTYVIFVSSISSLIFAILGFGIHFLLELKVPEFLELLSGLESRKDFSAESSASTSSNNFRQSATTSESVSIDGKSDDLGVDISSKVKDRSRDGKFGDHMIIENITIKNEPKLMAEAIRTMLAKDDEAG